MNKSTIERFPPNRVATVDVGALSRERHLITGLFEVDVTEARRRLRDHRDRSGERLSFTAWLIGALAETLAEYPAMHASRMGPLWRVMPSSVDVSALVEREVDGQLIPVPTLIRGADRLDVAAITAALHGAREGPVATGSAGLSGPRALKVAAWAMAVLPGVVRRSAWRLALAAPWVAKALMGSAVVTSVGMMGRVDGWFIPTSIHPLSLGVGSVVRKPRVLADDTIVPRDVLQLTLLMDHDAVDGADMARFVEAFARRLEEAGGLPA